MGMFDTLYADCPNCGTPTEEQTKAGHCILDDIHVERAEPEQEILFTKEIFTCQKPECRTRFTFKFVARPALRAQIIRNEDEDYSDRW